MCSWKWCLSLFILFDASRPPFNLLGNLILNLRNNSGKLTCVWRIVLMSVFCGVCSMTLSSVRQQSVISDHDQSDQEHVYNMRHPRRGHLVVINNRRFQEKTGKSERGGSDVDAANLFAAFKQLGFQVDLKSNLTCSEMLHLAIECKLIFSSGTKLDNRTKFLGGFWFAENTVYSLMLMR